MIAKTTEDKKILILERDMLLREALAEILSLNGYNTYLAENGENGITLAKKVNPDLILCASQFADMSCWEIYTNLRKEKSTRYIPFICLSSEPISDEDKNQSNQILILIKPFGIKKLLHQIKISLLRKEIKFTK